MKHSVGYNLEIIEAENGVVIRQIIDDRFKCWVLGDDRRSELPTLLAQIIEEQKEQKKFTEAK